jgi:hypothetical protein
MIALSQPIRQQGVLLGMQTMDPDELDSDRRLAAGILVRDEPEEDEDEDEENGGSDEEDDDADGDEGYSE